MLKDLYLNLEPKKILMVGFNRRFSQFIINIKNKLEKIKTPKTFIYNINAGFLPAEHWIKKTAQGGRLIGEACHFIDLIRFLSGSKIKSNFINKITDDTFIINLTFENGDISSIHYTSEGTKSFPKERLEVFSANEIITLNNFRSIRYWNNSKMNKKRFFSQDKGHLKCISSFLDSIENSKQSPIPIEEIFEVQEVLLELANS